MHKGVHFKKLGNSSSLFCENPWSTVAHAKTGGTGAIDVRGDFG
jgi:hypothetical protein